MKFGALWVVVFVLALELAAQGPPPRRAYASRCGAEVAWQQDFEAAMKVAEAEQKPVFWFVPSAYRSPLDRKQEVYWYAMGGAFSEPRVVQWLNENFVPLKLSFSALVRGSDEVATVNRKQMVALSERYGLKALAFVEPGFVILDPAGDLLYTADHQLSFQVDWFAERMDRVLAKKADALGRTITFPEAAKDALTPLRELMAQAEFAAALAWLKNDSKDLKGDLQEEAAWLEGLAQRYLAEDREALKVWTQLGRSKSESIWAARAQLEVDGWGPFSRGFAQPQRFPEVAESSGDLRRSRMTAVEASLEERLDLGLDFLVRMQREDGSFSDSTYDFGGLDSLPNVHMAVTALAARGLLEWRERAPERIDQALAKALPYLLNDRMLAAKDVDEMIWAQVYRLQFLLRLIEVEPKHRDQVKDDIARIVRDLEKSQLKGGAYRHEYANPFATASAILALDLADRAKFRVREKGLKAAAKALKGSRDDDGIFGYGMGPGSSIEFGAGRMPLCELALFLTGESSTQSLRAAIEASFKHHDLYENVRNYDDHTQSHRIGGFFYWYDMLGRAEAVQRLESSEVRQAFNRRLETIVADIQESDGSWVDSHELGKSYGTGMALTILGLARDQKKP